MELAKTIESVRALVRQAKAEGRKVGFVPTMGALHRGHISLIEEAARQTDFVVVSIFVNPAQFGPSEDFGKYPRTLDADLKVCEKAGAAAVFVPSVGEMYPQENLAWVNVEKLCEPLCGRGRKGHFRGVATVCAKLFNIIGPDMAFFGQKDVQQAVIITRMVEDLDMPLKIVVCPTVRESDGLAMSSRNAYLNAEERRQAALLYAALKKCENMFEKEGVRQSGRLVEAMKEILRQGADIRVEYVEIVSLRDLEDIDIITDKAIAAIAAKVGGTRLIDNIILDLNRK